MQSKPVNTKQIETWTGAFGAQYTERCTFESDGEFNALYVRRYGVSRDDINRDWLGNLPRDARILEIGCNIGNQLRALQRIGFTNLYGIDVQRVAVEKSKELYRGIDAIVGSAFDIPFKDGFFDVVFTNNVLIHISPQDIGRVIDEMVRVSGHYVWGFEYYAPQFTEINYRGHTNLLWKADYSKCFLKRHPALLEAEREKIFDCLDEPGNRDKCYLLRRRSEGGPR